MILQLNDSVFSKTDEQSLISLAKLLKSDNLAFHKLYIVDKEQFSGVKDLLFNGNDYFAQYEKNIFFEILEKEEQQAAYLTKTHKYYLTTIQIGYDDGEITPSLACKVISEPSFVILENGTNDWKFIKAIVKLYRNDRDGKNIYKLLDNAIDQKLLLADNAGGAGSIMARIEALIDGRYKEIFKFKIATVFDSDRNENTIINEKYANLIHSLANIPKDQAIRLSDLSKSDSLIIWHILYKRELENYLPAQILHNIPEIDDEIIGYLKQKLADEYDFIDIEKEITGQNREIRNLKSTIPDLFLSHEFTKVLLEERCMHHKEKISLPNGILKDVSEIEVILLKLAKII